MYLTQNATNTLIVHATDSVGNIGTGSIVIVEATGTDDFTGGETVTAADLPFVATASGGDPSSTDKITILTPITFNPTGNIRVTLPSGTDITDSSGGTFDATALAAAAASVTGGLDTNESSDGAIEFGISGIGLNFSRPIKVEIPVTGVTTSTITVKVKHGGTSTFVTTGLTNDPTATCTNGIPSISSNIATVSAGVATIYTCSASTFTAYSTTSVIIS